MRGTLRLARAGATLVVAGILVAASPPSSEIPVEVAPGLGGKHFSVKSEDAPPPGACRLWYPNRKRADQPPPGPCASLPQNIPAGAWILHRAPDGKRLLRLQ